MPRARCKLYFIALAMMAAAPSGAAAADPGPAVSVSSTSHTVVEKDFLSRLAERYYGDPNLWRRIAEANSHIINDPDLIYPGQVLEIPPAQASLRPPAQVMEPPPPPPPEVSAATAKAEAAGAPGVILERLLGLVLVNDPKRVAAEGLSGVSGVHIQDLPLLERGGIREKLAGYLGKPLTKDSKARILADIVLSLRQQRRSLVDVSTPPQEITGGVLQIVVIEGAVGQIRVEGGRWFSSSNVVRQLRVQKGSALDVSALSEDLDWLNRNPFRTVDLVYAKGAEPGKTDLVLRQTDRFPLRVYTGYEDSGTTLTGHNRWLTGFNWGNVFGGEGLFNYQFIADPEDFRRFRVHSGSFLQPLPWRHTVTAFYSHVDTRVNIPPLFKLGGFSWQAGGRYEAPLPRLGAYKHAAVAGFDFKRANNALAFGAVEVFNTTTDVVEWSLGYNSSFNDRFGRTTFRGTGYYSPGAISGKNKSANFRRARAGAGARYSYAKIELNRTNRLPFEFLLVNLLTVQRSDSNLLGSEQIGFGGYDTIRGYDSRVFNTDQGYIVSNELRTPSISLSTLLGPKRLSRVADKLQFLGFADYGVGSNKNLLAGEKSSTVLFGAGPGLRYTVAPYLTVRADYGWQLRNAETRRRIAARWHIAAVASF